VGEGLGTAFLLAIVVGSGIMGERLAGGNVAVALLANSMATGAGLVALILMLGSISEVMRGNLCKREGLAYVAVQVFGAFLGVAIAHSMFGEAVFTASEHERSGAAQLFSEFIATFGLVAVIRGVGRAHKSAVPIAVGAYIASAYWFTASTSFANLAVTLARAFTPTFAGIRPADVMGFWIAQLLGAIAAEYLFRWFQPLPNFKNELGS